MSTQPSHSSSDSQHPASTSDSYAVDNTSCAKSVRSDAYHSMSFQPAPFDPPRWLRNAHLQSILPKFVAPKPPTYRRVLMFDSLGQSQMAYDYLDANSANASPLTTDALTTNSTPAQPPLVVLFHGMEGGSDSHYACSLAQVIHEAGWHFVVVHFRSCGGVPATGKRFYNAGDTTEIQHALQHLAKQYQTIFAIGVSLGGNALAKYLGEYSDQALCQRAVVVSAPVDLASSAVAMRRWIGQHIYTPYLLRPIVAKAIAHAARTQDLSAQDLNDIKACRSIYEFDHLFTAPRHGYTSVNHYYREASSLPYLDSITCPTLIITAKDDPFLGLTARPEDVSAAVTLLDTDYGGHVGYVQFDASQRKFDTLWMPKTAQAFFALGLNHGA